MYGAGAAFFGPKPELIKFGRSRSRLRDLGLPEPPKKWRLRTTAKIQPFANLFIPPIAKAVGNKKQISAIRISHPQY